MTVSQLIAEAIAAGRVRKFRAGESGFVDGIQVFLRDRGINLYQLKNQYVMKRGGQKGALKRIPWEKVIEEVDRIRVAEGLQPLRLPHQQVSEKAAA